MKTNSPPSSSSLAGALLSTRPTTHPHTRKRSTQLTQQREINGRGEQQATGDECLEEQNAMEAHVYDD